MVKTIYTTKKSTSSKIKIAEIYCIIFNIENYI